MRALVTGGCGFIGSHLVESLAQAGHEVRVFDDMSTGQAVNVAHLAGAVDVVKGDVRSDEQTLVAAQGCEVVFHLAAVPSVPRSLREPLRSHAVNATGTLNVVQAARAAGARRLVYASSSSVYGANAAPPTREDTPLAPVSPYAVAKLAGEGYCRALTENTGPEVVVLRLFNVYGPRQDPLSRDAAVIPSFVRAMLGGQRPVVFGDGAQSRDFTYVTDVVAACLLASEAAGVAGGTYNVAGSSSVTITQLLFMLSELIGGEVKPVFAEPRAAEVRHSGADISRARRDLGFAPSVDLHDGLPKTIAAVRATLQRPAGATADRARGVARFGTG